jgi:hypothetical protein
VGSDNPLKPTLKNLGVTSQQANSGWVGVEWRVPLHYYIVGTEHRLQVPSPLRAAPDVRLRDLMQDIINKKNVVLIAEEVDPNKDVQSFGRKLIGDEKWRSIDMTRCDQHEAGIFDDLEEAYRILRDTGRNVYHKRANSIREYVWLDRVRHFLEQHQTEDGVVLITCGRNHLEFLAQKVAKMGILHTETECPLGLQKTLRPLEVLP